MWQLAGKTFRSRLICGTALFPSPEIMQQAIIASGAEAVTVSLRRQSPEAGGGSFFWDLIKNLNVHVLPNTAGCRSSKEAITIAHMARELFNTNWIKLEITGDDYTLQPDPFALVEAAKALINDGFEIFPYTTSDLVVAQRLVEVGCKIVMPWASPIGSGQGINDKRSLDILRMRLPDTTLIVDAGIGKPSHAAQIMEMGYDGVILTSAIALAHQPAEMARAFSLAIEAGRAGYESGFMEKRSIASPSTPTIGTPFWHKENLSDQSRPSLDRPVTATSPLTESIRSYQTDDFSRQSAKISKQSVKKSIPIAWTIGGSDSGGGAGIQADIKTFNALGVHGCSVITAVTAQNTAKVESIAAVSPNSIQAQIETLSEDLSPLAVKTGMLYSHEIIKQVSRFFAQTKAYKICDPVMVATSGNSLVSSQETTKAFVEHLLPYVDLLTPNLPEAEALSTTKTELLLGTAESLLEIKDQDTEARWLDEDYIQELASQLRVLGPRAVLIKGGHSQGNLCRDYFAGENISFWLTSERIDTDSTHGTGCTLSAAIAACIALAYPIEDAVVIAKAYVNQSLRMSTQIGKGHGPVRHGTWPETFTDIPTLTVGARFTEPTNTSNTPSVKEPTINKKTVGTRFTEPTNTSNTPPVKEPTINKKTVGTRFTEPTNTTNADKWNRGRDLYPPLRAQRVDADLNVKNTSLQAFSDCGSVPLGIYPIVDNSAWLEKLLPLGFTTAQLRIKEGLPEAIEQEIIKSIAIAKQFNCRLFINDYWQYAITHGAYGVHLGQEDLNEADIKAILEAGIRLGISTHSYAEVARAIALKPSYIAIGPIYHTTLKSMAFAPQGIAALKRWRRTLPYPLVAIGGITLERLPDVLNAGSDSAAVISDILQDKDPLAKAKAWLDAYSRLSTSYLACKA